MTDLTEQVARQICVEDGYNPDATVYGDGAFHEIWERYKPHTKVAIAIIRPEVLQEAAGWHIQKAHECKDAGYTEQFHFHMECSGLILDIDDTAAILALAEGEADDPSFV